MASKFILAFSVLCLVGCSARIVRHGDPVDPPRDAGGVVAEDLSPAPPMTSATMASLKMSAQRVAGPRASAMWVVSAALDRATAVRALGGGEVSAHAPVYVVAMQGSFQPTRVPSASFNVMAVTFDARTMAVLDVAYLPTTPDLSSMGNVVEMN